MLYGDMVDKIKNDPLSLTMSRSDSDLYYGTGAWIWIWITAISIRNRKVFKCGYLTLIVLQNLVKSVRFHIIITLLI